MSDLRIDILLAGAILVVLVIAYNKWQEYRLKKRGDAAFGSRHADVLVTPRQQNPASQERIEPVIGAGTDELTPVRGAHSTPVFSDVAADSMDSSARDEAMDSPAMNTPAGAAVEQATPAARSPHDLPLDDRVDAVALLLPPANETLSGAPILDADWSGFTHIISLFGENEHGWEELDAEGAYQRVALGLQLADRKGPLPGMELAKFAESLEALARAQGCYLEMSSSEVILDRAASLDRLCAEVDFQIALDLLAPADRPFPGTRIRALAEANGMVLPDDGSFKRRDHAGNLWFTLKNRGATPFSPEHMREFSTRGLTLALDAARAPRAAFPAMRAFAETLCESMQGNIADEQGRTLDGPALDRVGAQLAAIHSRLEASGIAPGGALALRLFA